MAWRRTAPSHYLNHCWPDSYMHISSTRRRRVNVEEWYKMQINVSYVPSNVNSACNELNHCCSWLWWKWRPKTKTKDKWTDRVKPIYPHTNNFIVQGYNELNTMWHNSEFVITGHHHHRVPVWYLYRYSKKLQDFKLDIGMPRETSLHN